MARYSRKQSRPSRQVEIDQAAIERNELLERNSRLRAEIAALHIHIRTLRNELRLAALTNDMLLTHKENLMVEVGHARQAIEFLQGRDGEHREMRIMVGIGSYGAN